MDNKYVSYSGLLYNYENKSLITELIDGLNIPSNFLRIGNWAFYNCYNLTTVSFPNCSYIGSSAFCQCIKLTTANFPNCTYIKSWAFTNCYSLTTANFPNCTYIEGYAFNGTALTTANFPKCTYIDYGAFQGIGKLTTASFPKCSYIGNYAFCRCFRLTSVYLMSTTVVSLYDSVAFSSTPIAGYTYYTSSVYGSIFVPASLLNSYKTATNWTYFSSRFVGV